MRDDTNEGKLTVVFRRTIKTVSISSGNLEKTECPMSYNQMKHSLSPFESNHYHYQNPTTPNALELLQMEYLIPCR